MTTPTVTTAILRGDQQPPNDDDLNEDDPEFYPLGGIDYRYHVIKNPLYHTVGRGLLVFFLYLHYFIEPPSYTL